MPFNDLTMQTAEAIMAEFKKLFSTIQIYLVWNQYYSDKKEQLPISIEFKIDLLKEEVNSRGYYEYTNHGRLLNAILGTNALDIVPESSTENYLAPMTKNNQTKSNSSLPPNVTIDKSNKIKNFPRSFYFLIRGCDPELLQYFQRDSTVDDKIIPEMISDLIPSGAQRFDASSWNFSAIINIETLAVNNYAYFYSTCLSQELILSSGEIIAIPAYRQKEFLIQVKTKKLFLEKFGKHYANKLNTLFSTVIKENVIIVTDSLFMQINNFVEYALMVALESEELIQPIEYPNTQYKIWCITEIEQDTMDALNQETFIQEYQAHLAECEVLKEVIDLPFVYDGRGFLLFLSKEKEISADQVSLLRYITNGRVYLENDTVLNIYKQFFHNDKYTIHPYRYGFPIPERIQWIKETAVYRENIRLKLNELEMNHQVGGQNMVQQFDFDSCLRTTICDDSPLLTLLNKWVKEDLIIIETNSNKDKLYFASNKLSVQIIECKNVNKLTDAIEELKTGDCTQSATLQKKVTSQQLPKIQPSEGSIFKPPAKSNIKSCKTTLQNRIK